MIAMFIFISTWYRNYITIKIINNENWNILLESIKSCNTVTRWAHFRCLLIHNRLQCIFLQLCQLITNKCFKTHGNKQTRLELWAFMQHLKIYVFSHIKKHMLCRDEIIWKIITTNLSNTNLSWIYSVVL